MAEWEFDLYRVVRDGDQLWHVTGRWLDIDSGRREYMLEDMTWTRGERRDADWFEDEAEATRHRVEGTKPAVEIGYRVNGMLSGPDEAQRRLHRRRDEDKLGCVHEQTPCSHCGVEDSEEIYIVQTPSSSDEETTIWCRVCGHMEVVRE